MASGLSSDRGDCRGRKMENEELRELETLTSLIDVNKESTLVLINMKISCMQDVEIGEKRINLFGVLSEL